MQSKPQFKPQSKPQSKPLHKKPATHTPKTTGKTTGKAGLNHLPAEPVLRGRAGLVVFSSEIGAWWSRFLPRPWRHCFVLFALTGSSNSAKPQGWLLLDPCHGRTELSWLSPATGARLLNRVQLGGQAAIVPYKPHTTPQKQISTGSYPWGLGGLRLGVRFGVCGLVRSLVHSLAHSLPLGGCVWQVQQVLGIPALSFSPSGLYRRLMTHHTHERKKYFSADPQALASTRETYFPFFH